MAGFKVIEFDPQNILNLLTHYSSGDVPLDAELVAIGHHQVLQREIGMLVQSNQWRDDKLPGQDAYAPLYINYEGKKVMTWGTRDGNDMKWTDAPVDNQGIVL